MMDEIQIENDALKAVTESVQHKVTYNKIPVVQSTFKAGMNSGIHRWFRLTPSFGPDLVRTMLSELQSQQHEVVFDPFTGAGTTLIECQLHGLTAYGVEINPVLHFVASTSLNWSLSIQQLKEAFESIRETYLRDCTRVSIANLSQFGLQIPPIHNPTRWWRPDILAQLLLLKQLIDTHSGSVEAKQFFRLALANALVPDLTNVTLGRLQLHFIDRSEHDIRVLETFSKHVKAMFEDLAQVQESELCQTSRVFFGDTLDVGTFGIEEQIDCVITSPPYPNRYSYVWNTRPHLYFLDFFSNAREASDLDKRTIGGTWGTATSVLTKGEVPPQYQVVDEVVSPIASKIRLRDNLMANYVMKYFNLLASQIMSMEPLLSPHARVAYVVGCSNIKDVYIETDVILARIFEGLNLGYSVREIKRIRRRNSGKDLHESIVYAWKMR